MLLERRKKRNLFGIVGVIHKGETAVFHRALNVNPGCFTALLMGLAEAGSCTVCCFCIPCVLSKLNGWTSAWPDVRRNRTVLNFFQEFSCSVPGDVVSCERWWCWVRVVFLGLSSASYLPGLAVLFNSPGAVCSSGKGVMTHPICREFRRGLSVWNFWQDSGSPDLHPLLSMQLEALQFCIFIG